ncbi:DUF202 domain-containing protein [Rhodococcus erythropolis]|nr:DUF202 domain-containing protein [Rhodococcus erythropolis]
MTSDPNATDRRWPAKLYSVGSEPDPRFSLANERTLLAWIRTSLAFLALGVALDALDDIVTAGQSSFLAFGSVSLALLCAVGGVRRWWRNERALRRVQPLSAPLTAVAVTVMVGGAAALFLALAIAGRIP